MQLEPSKLLNIYFFLIFIIMTRIYGPTDGNLSLDGNLNPVMGGITEAGQIEQIKSAN
jgi:hypothetical protein